jgi:uncharacterized protein (DUF885 family)
LLKGFETGHVASQRLAEACAEQAATWGGQRDAPAFFLRMIEAAPGGTALSARLDRAATAASAAYAVVGDWLIEDYLPRADPEPAAGPERYQLWARSALGAAIDAEETYDWGWDELARIEADMAETAERIRPGATLAEVIDFLEADPQRSIEGVDIFRQWLQDLMDRTIEELSGRHFDIADRIKRVEAMIAPPGGGAAMYYTGPSEDFSRPGRTWYPTLGKTRFPLWGEVSIAYHEGVPGHHLQIAQVRHRGDQLSRFQRIAFVSGHGEGWALYAERLMDELGFLANPDHRLGMLRAQAMRATRVIVDIGMHLKLEIPPGWGYEPGDRWTPERGQEFALAHSYFPADFMRSEIVRYLGNPAQAISYKVGERVWIEARAGVETRQGSAFDLKAFHEHALNLGPLGLDHLREELARI